MEHIQLTNNGSSGKTIELVGMDQIAEYQLHSDIKDVELCDSAIISLGESLPPFSAVKRLNLSGNQIRSFKTVVEILSCFSSLQILLLNSNPLKASAFPSFSSNLTVAFAAFCFMIDAGSFSHLLAFKRPNSSPFLPAGPPVSISLWQFLWRSSDPTFFAPFS